MSPESKRRQIFDPDEIYETSQGLAHPPGKPPAGYRWSGVRSSETNPALCRWQLVSTDTELPSIDELPPPGFERHELSTIKPPTLKSKKGGLTRPKDVGIPRWLEPDLKD